jgi:cytochrome c553
VFHYSLRQFFSPCNNALGRSTHENPARTGHKTDKKPEPSMTLSRVLTGLAAGAALAIAVPAFAQGDASAGVQKKQMCEGCHGISGYRTAYPTVYSAPKLGGQTAAYIVKALKDYAAGARSHPSMNGVAGSLTEQDMADLAAYYAGEGK